MSDATSQPHTPVQRVEGNGGLRGILRGGLPPGGRGQVTVELDDGRPLQVPAEVLQRRPDGSLFLPLSPDDVKGRLGPAGGSSGALAGEAGRKAGGDVAPTILDSAGRMVVPVAREELDIRKRQVETGRVSVRVTPRVRQEVVEVPLAEEQVEVERVAINRPVEGPTPVRQEGDVTIVPVFEEVLVVEKRLMLKEEIRLTRRRSTRRERQEVELRQEEVNIHREGAADAPGADRPGPTSPESEKGSRPAT